MKSSQARAACVTTLGVFALIGGCLFHRTVDLPSVSSWDSEPLLACRVERGDALRAESAQEVARLEDAGLLLEDETLSAYLAGVLDRLWGTRASLPDDVRILVLDDASAEAAMWAHGAIVFGGGALGVLEDESQLAWILGHELIHLLECHAEIEADFAARSDSYVERMAVSRTLEQRSDAGAQSLTESSGYAPAGGPRALAVLDAFFPEAGRTRPRWRSHDSRVTRSLRMRSAGWAAAARGVGSAFPERYQAAIDPIRLRVAEHALRDGNLRLVRRLLDVHDERLPGRSETFVLRAELAQQTVIGEDLLAVRERYLEAAVEADEGNPDALRALGLLRRDQGDDEAAAALLRRYLDAAPDAIDRRLIRRYLEE